MRRARVFVNKKLAGIFTELTPNHYEFVYDSAYQGNPVSLTMPLQQSTYTFQHFPAFFDGLLPEGAMLEALLKMNKIDRTDYFGQLLQVGQDVIGAVSVEHLS